MVPGAACPQNRLCFCCSVVVDQGHEVKQTQGHHRIYFCDKYLGF